MEEDESSLGDPLTCRFSFPAPAQTQHIEMLTLEDPISMRLVLLRTQRSSRLLPIHSNNTHMCKAHIVVVGTYIRSSSSDAFVEAFMHIRTWEYQISLKYTHTCTHAQNWLCTWTLKIADVGES